MALDYNDAEMNIHETERDEVPKGPYKNNVFSDSDEEAMYCAICQQKIQNDEKIVELKCQHIYHPECAKKWVLENKKCPVCRKR